MEGGQTFGRPTQVDGGLRLVHCVGGIERASRVIGLGQRRAEDRHHRIADELHHRATVGEDGAVHFFFKQKTAYGMFWKTRYQSSIDGSNTSFRTLVSYKETFG